MHILVAVASRHGSTDEIAQAIAQELREAGHTADVQHAGEVGDTAAYGAAIIGSAVYMGNWLPDARRFVDRNRQWLATVPVWLFSSGPLGREHPQPKGDPSHLAELLQSTHARDHRNFVGKLDAQALSLGERLTAKVVRAPEGDFRDWETIRGWAMGIATALQTPATSGV